MNTMKTLHASKTNAAVCHCGDRHFDGKCHLYKTAQAVIGCAKFKAGEYVSVSHYFRDDEGTNWFLITRTERGVLEHPVAYPEHHLNYFCL